MAAPLNQRKASVNLAAKGVPGSRIRRDPPPVAKKIEVADRDELDRRAAAIGIIVFAMAITIVLVGLGSWAGWSPSQYTLNVDDRGGF
jgi:hypothetical protein